MKILYPILAALGFSVGFMPAKGQVYNDGAISNAADLLSDWSTQYVSTIGATYTTAGSTGAPSSYGVFEHRGQNGTGANAAFVNNGTYNASVNGRDYFLGPNGVAGQQEISGSSMPTFAELFIQNGATAQFDITNTGGIQVVTSVTFQNGITTTVRNNNTAAAIKFADNATYIGGNTDAQHVNGYVSKEGDDIFTFPVGDGSQLRTLSFSSAPALGSNVSVAWFTGDPGTVTDPSDNTTHSTGTMSSGLQWISQTGFWDWVPVSGTFTNGITVSIPDLSSSGVSAADLRLAGWNGSQWIPLGTTGASGNTAGSTLSGTMLSGITAIGIGGVSNPLPITFSDFTVNKEGCKAMISWKTAMEQSNDHFEVERSTNGLLFSKIGSVKSQGNSNQEQVYSLYDLHPQPGENYYRVTQIDLNGKHSSTRIKSLNFNCNNAEIKVYPTITKGTLYVDLPAGYEQAELSIYTILGQQLKLYNTGRIDHSGIHNIQFTGLAQGQYLLKVTKDNEVYTFNVIYKQ